MYEYRIKGTDYLKGKVQKIGQAIAVTVDKGWLDKEVIVVKEPELTGLNKTLNTKPKRLEIEAMGKKFRSMEEFEEYFDCGTQIKNMNPDICFDDLSKRIAFQLERNKEAMGREKKE